MQSGVASTTSIGQRITSSTQTVTFANHHFGEGNYAELEHVLQDLLREAGHQNIASGTVSVSGAGVEAAADMTDIKSPETYIGTDRAENFASPGGASQDQVHAYTSPSTLARNQWALTGDWRVGEQDAVLAQPGGGITYRFHARDLYLVLGPVPDGKPAKFQVLIDGHAPGPDHGVDIDANGDGVIMGQRLYQLMRLSGDVRPAAGRERCGASRTGLTGPGRTPRRGRTGLEIRRAVYTNITTPGSMFWRSRPSMSGVVRCRRC